MKLPIHYHTLTCDLFSRLLSGWNRRVHDVDNMEMNGKAYIFGMEVEAVKTRQGDPPRICLYYFSCHVDGVSLGCICSPAGMLSIISNLGVHHIADGTGS